MAVRFVGLLRGRFRTFILESEHIRTNGSGVRLSDWADVAHGDPPNELSKLFVISAKQPK